MQGNSVLIQVCGNCIRVAPAATSLSPLRNSMQDEEHSQLPLRSPTPIPFLKDGHPLVLLSVPCHVSWLKSHSILIRQSFLVFVSACLFHFALGVSSFTLWDQVSFPSAGWPRNHCVAHAELQFMAIFLTQPTKYWNFPCGLPQLAISLLNLAVLKVDKKTKRVQWEISNYSGIDADF